MEVLEKLTTVLSKLPGIGRRSAERMTIKLVREPDKLIAPLIDALKEAKNSLCCCERCGNITSVDKNPCRLCMDHGRDGAIVCVIEDPSDIVSIERSGGFRGRYHALMGKLSPMKGNGPGDIRLKELAKRIEVEGIKEVVLALSTDMEGDSTASFIEDMLKGRPVRVSRIAFGLPAGSGVSYSDPVTLARAIAGRRAVDGGQ